MKTPPFFTVIIPVRDSNKYLLSNLEILKKQKGLEILVITDKISQNPNPSIKRNLGASKAQGIYLVFLDDDSFPSPNYFSNLKKLITHNSKINAFCGPSLTPESDNNLQKASGLFFSSLLGSGGAGHYRNSLGKTRFVDDYPTVNLIVKKETFISIGGFQSKYWPGEDTIFCLDLVYKFQEKILYSPTIPVYHHRRSVFIPHLQQLQRYARHRGLFVKKFPKTSFRIGYFLPSVFFLYLNCLLIYRPNILLLPLYIYLLALFSQFIFNLKNNSLIVSTLTLFATPVSHYWYGLNFIIGLTLNDLKFTPHRVHKRTGQYIGG